MQDTNAYTDPMTVTDTPQAEGTTMNATTTLSYEEEGTSEMLLALNICPNCLGRMHQQYSYCKVIFDRDGAETENVTVPDDILETLGTHSEAEDSTRGYVWVLPGPKTYYTFQIFREQLIDLLLAWFVSNRAFERPVRIPFDIFKKKSDSWFFLPYLGHEGPHPALEDNPDPDGKPPLVGKSKCGGL